MALAYLLTILSHHPCSCFSGLPSVPSTCAIFLLSSGLCTCYSLCLEYSFFSSSHSTWLKQLLFPILVHNWTSVPYKSPHWSPHVPLGEAPQNPLLFLQTLITTLIYLLKQYIFLSLNDLSKENRRPHILVHHKWWTTAGISINIYWVNK